MTRIFILVLALGSVTASAAPTAKELLDAERAAYDKARPVFEKACAACHTKDGAKVSPKKLDHFDMTSYPFGGHHAKTIGTTIETVLGLGKKKATMPDNAPGSVKGADLDAIEAWAKAWKAADKAGAHATK